MLMFYGYLNGCVWLRRQLVLVCSFSSRDRLKLKVICNYLSSALFWSKFRINFWIYRRNFFLIHIIKIRFFNVCNFKFFWLFLWSRFILNSLWSLFNDVKIMRLIFSIFFVDWFILIDWILCSCLFSPLNYFISISNLFISLFHF